MPPSLTATRQSGRLPLELERIVFELAAHSHSTIPTLILVAHRVRVWLEPLLYRVLRLDDLRRTPAILEAINTKPAPFLAESVRHVLVYSSTHSMEPEALQRFLSSCPGITNLALIGNIAGPHLLPALADIPIERLGANLRQLFRNEDGDQEDDEEENTINLEHPLFAAVTHLDIFDELDFYDDDAEGMDWVKDLDTLPALTHLSFSSPPSGEMLHAILTSCPRLRVVIVQFEASDEADVSGYTDAVAISDSRFVVAVYSGYYADWERGARGGVDIWRRAEDFIARKTRGEIEEDVYILGKREDIED